MSSAALAVRAVAAAGMFGAGVLAFAAPATAASGDSVTVNQATSFTTRNDQLLSIAATAAGHCSSGKSLTRAATLSLVGPAGADSTTTVVRSVHRPCQQDVSLTESIAAPKRNGAYQVLLQNGSGAAQASTADLDVLIPPAKPRHLKVRTSNSIASFTWTATAEPDVTAYQVATTQGYVAATVRPDRSCGGPRCAAAVNMGERYLGSTVYFVVRAERCGRSCGHSIVGPDSTSVAATFAGAPPPQGPAPSPISTPPGQAAPPPTSTGSGGDGSATGPSGLAGSLRHRHHRLPSAADLPPLPHHASSPPLATAQPSTGVDAPPPSAATATATTSRSTLHAVAQNVSRALKAAPLWRGVAAVAVLVLLGVHLRAWSRRLTPT